ncbi:MAG: efflux RND transporter periplasmic adaptor subunit [Gemmatimonadales bacterium]
MPAADQRRSLDAPAQIVFDPARVALITPRAAGRLERLAAVEGDQVRAGQPVAYLSSTDFLTAETDFVQARRRAATLAATLDAGAAADLETAARRRLELLGAPANLIAGLEAGAEPTLLLPVTAPFRGSIVSSMILAGAAVEPGTPLFRLADLDVVNAVAQVPERALAAVQAGQSATVSLAAYPGQQFPGVVSRLRSELDSTTRTVQAVVRVANPLRRLRAGMFATVHLAARLETGTFRSSGDSVLTIPELAVVTEGERRYVFVELAPRTFERRSIEVSSFNAVSGDTVLGGRVVVRSGLRAGEGVVVKGAFTLQSELGKASFGEQEG